MPSQPITEEQFKQLLQETKKEKNKFIQRRDSLMYKILYHLGLRPGECRLIELSHLNFKEQTLFIPAKNNKERQEDEVWFPDFLMFDIKKYLQERGVNSRWLFPGGLNKARNQDVPVDSRTTQFKFSERMKSLGFMQLSYYDKSNNPHYTLNLYSFRKRFGTFIYIKTRDPKITANLLRHYDKELKSVWSYVFFAEKGERKQLMQQIYENL